MMMDLANFEDYIESIIIMRGYDYYMWGHVVSVSKTDECRYVAKVKGTNTYTVDVEMDDDMNIVFTYCNCPYDMGELCKHQAAVFFSMRDMFSGSPGEQNSKDRDQLSIGYECTDPKTMESGRTRVHQVLMSRSKEDLVEFLQEIAAENDEIWMRFKLKFDEGDDKGKVSRAVGLIQSFSRQNSDRHGFVDYENTFNAVQGAKLVLEQIIDECAKGKLFHGFNLALCVVREMVDLIQTADDSSGVIGDAINKGFNMMEDIISREELNQSEQRDVFETLMEESFQERYDGWTDWRLNLIEICSRLSTSPDLRARFEEYFELHSKNESADLWSSRYFAEKVNQIRYNLILQHEGAEKASEFVEANLHFPNFRKMAMEQAMKNEDYDAVIKLAIEGEEQDRGLRGLVNDWRGYRYSAYELSGKLAEQRETALAFILDGSFEYYIRLKKTYNPGDWAKVYPEMINVLRNQKWAYTSIYPQILIEEDEKEKLLEYIGENPSLIESHYKYLVPGFETEVFQLFRKRIERVAKSASNRRDYQEVCAILVELKKAGGEEQASEIIKELYTQYKRKPAFKDELSRI